MGELNICDYKHSAIDREIEQFKESETEQDIKLDNHEKRIIILEKLSYATDIQMKNVLDAISNLISWIKWGLAFVIPATIGMFVWLLQQQLVK